VQGKEAPLYSGLFGMDRELFGILMELQSAETWRGADAQNAMRPRDHVTPVDLTPTSLTATFAHQILTQVMPQK